MAIQTLLFDEETQHNNKPPTKTGEGDAHTDRSDSMADAYYQCQTNRYCQERSDSVNFPQSQSCCHFSRYFMKMKNGETSVFFHALCFPVCPSFLPSLFCVWLWFVVGGRLHSPNAPGLPSHLLPINPSTSVKEPRSFMQWSPDCSFSYLGRNLGHSQLPVSYCSCCYSLCCK